MTIEQRIFTQCNDLLSSIGNGKAQWLADENARRERSQKNTKRFDKICWIFVGLAAICLIGFFVAIFFTSDITNPVPTYCGVGFIGSLACAGLIFVYNHSAISPPNSPPSFENLPLSRLINYKSLLDRLIGNIRNLLPHVNLPIDGLAINAVLRNDYSQPLTIGMLVKELENLNSLLQRLARPPASPLVDDDRHSYSSGFSLSQSRILFAIDDSEHEGEAKSRPPQALRVTRTLTYQKSVSVLPPAPAPAVEMASIPSGVLAPPPAPGL